MKHKPVLVNKQTKSTTACLRFLYLAAYQQRSRVLSSNLLWVEMEKSRTPKRVDPTLVRECTLAEEHVRLRVDKVMDDVIERKDEQDRGETEGEDEEDEEDEEESEREDLFIGLTAHIKHNLKCHLDRVNCTKSIATYGTCANPVITSIHVTGVGSIGFPLLARDAEALVGGDGQASDRRESKRLELDASEWKIENPSWERMVHEIEEKVATELGVCAGVASVKAVPRKMSLCGKGTMLEANQGYVKLKAERMPSLLTKVFRSEEAPQKFGTLIICLPSKHEGGDICVSHGSQQMVLNTAISSQYDYSYLAWCV